MEFFLAGEVAGLGEEFIGEIEGGEAHVAALGESECHAAGAAAGFEERGALVGKMLRDELFLGGPEPEPVRGARVMQDGFGRVEIRAHGGAGDFFCRIGGGHRGKGRAVTPSPPRRGAESARYLFFQAARNMPLAFNSCGHRKSCELGAEGWALGSTATGSKSGCAAVKASAMAVVSARVSVQTA